MPDVRHARPIDNARRTARIVLRVLLLKEHTKEREPVTRHLAGVGINSFSPKPLAVRVVQVHLVLNDVVAPLELALRDLMRALERSPQKRVVARALFWMAVTKHEG